MRRGTSWLDQAWLSANNSNADFTDLKHQQSASLPHGTTLYWTCTWFATTATNKLIGTNHWAYFIRSYYTRVRMSQSVLCTGGGGAVLLYVEMIIQSKENLVMKKSKTIWEICVHWLNLQNEDFWGLPLWILLEEVYFSDHQTNWSWQPKLGFPVGWHQSKISGRERERKENKGDLQEVERQRWYVIVICNKCPVKSKTIAMKMDVLVQYFTIYR